MTTPTIEDAAKLLATPTAYTDEPRLHSALTDPPACLRAPVTHVKVASYNPFWVITKLAYTELNVAICAYAINFVAAGRLRPPGAAVYKRWRQVFLWSRALTISGGSSEIIRDVLAAQLFKFPKSW